jgi:hypothetical protein
MSARQLVRVCADGCGPDFIWPETPEHCSNCGAATIERETAESQRDRYREALLTWADRIERDRRESDKVLAYAQSMRREALRDA